MAGGQERVLRRRIRSIKATQKITRAMELIAASQIVRAQNRIAGGNAYQQGIARVLAEAAADVGGHAGRLLGVPENPRRVLVLAVVGDRGLAGGYNTNVLRTVERMVRSGREQNVEHRLVTAGKKAPAYLRFRGFEVAETFAGFAARPSFEDARRLAAAITPPFLDEEVDQVLIVSTRYLSAGSQVVETRQLLPLPEPAAATTGSAEPGARTATAAAVGVDPEPPGGAPGRATTGGYTEFEPDAREILADLIPRYVEAAVFGALLEAAASFFTAQQRAMAAATENADDLAKRLTRIMNRARQDAITTEIMEIVGGAEALRQAAD